MYDFGLYIHWPFCIKKCPYCDFNSYVFKHEQTVWVESLLKELVFASTFFNYKIRTIFFGGGTPSLISTANVKRILDKIQELWPFVDVEITLEVNPSSIESHDLEEFLNAGINRFSIGMQSLNDNDLKFLGRLHSAQEALDVLRHAVVVCDNVSADFIYALPDQNLKIWKNELNNILRHAQNLNLKHLSLYQLTIEENTKFHQLTSSDLLRPMNEDKQSVLYEYTYNTLSANNWDVYEISNAAKIDIKNNVPRGTDNIAIQSKYRSRHNLGYWNYFPYLGIGPGAHSRMFVKNKRSRFSNKKNPYKWKDSVDNLQIENFFDQKEDFIFLTEEEEFVEKLLMGLRLKEGVIITQSEMKYLNLHSLQMLLEKDYMRNIQDRYFLSLQGLLKLNIVLKFLLA